MRSRAIRAERSGMMEWRLRMQSRWGWMCYVPMTRRCGTLLLVGRWHGAEADCPTGLHRKSLTWILYCHHPRVCRPNDKTRSEVRIQIYPHSNLGGSMRLEKFARAAQRPALAISCRGRAHWSSNSGIPILLYPPLDSRLDLIHPTTVSAAHHQHPGAMRAIRRREGTRKERKQRKKAAPPSKRAKLIP